MYNVEPIISEATGLVLMHSNISQKQDEINLVELLQVIWKRKLIIFITTLLFTVLAGIYAFTAKERWTSTAVVIEPQLTDLGNYFEIRRDYARITESELNDNNFVNALFAQFNLLSYSLDEREAFIKNSAYYKNAVEGLNEQEKQVILSKIVNEDFSIIRPDPKKQPDLVGRKISFSATTASEAQDTLIQFMSFLNNNVLAKDIEKFFIILQDKIKDLEYEKSKIERELSILKNSAIQNLNEAYNIAKKAGIKEYSNTVGRENINQVLIASDTKIPLSESKLSDGSYLFMLGERYLKAQIDVVNQDKLIYPPRYYQITGQLKELIPLFEKLKVAKGVAFRYLSSPDYPITKDKPKKALILLIGFVLGLVTSVFAVVILNIITRTRK